MEPAFNRSLYVSVLLAISFYGAVDAAASSSSSSRPSARSSGSSAYALLSKADFDQVMFQSGNADSFRFYGEYRPMQQHNGDFLFPLRACDPVTVSTLGTLRYFFPSATEGKYYDSGYSAAQDRVGPLKIGASTITDVIALRGKHDKYVTGGFRPTGYRVELYLGYDKADLKKQGKKTVYAASLLYLYIKSTNIAGRSVDPYMKSLPLGDAQYASSHEVAQEVMKRCQEKELDRNLWSSTKPEFQAVLKELLGEGWVSTQIPIHTSSMGSKFAAPNCNFARDEQVVGFDKFYSTKVYWTALENRLKRTVYGRR